MNYCILGENNVIENIIVCADDETAALFGAVASYEEARIGDEYSPPEPEPAPEPEYVTYSELAAAIREGVNAV